MSRDGRTFCISVSTRDLIRAVWGQDVSYFNVGVYEGTNIPLRRLTGNEIVTVQGTTGRRSSERSASCARGAGRVTLAA